MIKAELGKIWQNKMLLITVMGIACVPILYAAFFLKGVWDPYGNLGSIKVAVVNEDKPVQYNGQELNVGQQVVDTLKKEQTFSWQFVNADQADKGMDKNDYYMVVTLPKDFSTKAATVTNANPEQMDIKYETNGSLNFPLETISGEGANQIKSQVSAQVTLAYANSIIDTIKQTGNSIQAAADGAGQLANGSKQVNDGAGQLADGTKQVSDGANQLAANAPALVNGLDQLNSGSTTLASGVSQLSAGSDQLADGVDQLVGQTKTSATTLQNSLPNVQQLNTGAHQLADGINQLNSPAVQQKLGYLTNLLNLYGADIDNLSQLVNSDKYNQLMAQFDQMIGAIDPASANSEQLKNFLIQLKTDLNTLHTKLVALEGMPNSSEIKNDLDTLTTGVGQLQQGSQQLATGTDTLYNQLSAMSNQLNSDGTNDKLASLSNGATQLKNGLDQLNSQVPTLTSGIAQLSTGSKQLAGGINQLNSGSKQLINGANQLSSGTKQLANGNNELHNQLQQGADTIKSTPLSDKTAQQIAQPVKTEQSKHSNVKNYGHGLAPYFMSVALFVGCMMFTLAYPVRKKADLQGSWLGWYGSKVFIAQVTATAMAVIEASIMLAVGLQVDNVAAFYGTLILYGNAVMALCMFLAMTFDNPGRFVAMLILILSLSASGGTFPVETSSAFYQSVHPFVPITYSLSALRNAISGGIAAGSISTAYLYFIVMLIVSLALMALSMYILNRWKGDRADRSRQDTNEDLLTDDYSNYQLKRA